MKIKYLKLTLKILICLLMTIPNINGVFAADTPSAVDGGPTANLARQKQVLTTLIDVAIKKLDIAESTVRTNLVLSSTAKQAILASLQGVEDQLISYRTRVGQAKTIVEAKALNQQIRQYLQTNKNATINSFKKAFEEIRNNALNKAKQLEATLRSTLTLLETLCPQQATAISTLKTQLNTLNTNLTALSTAIQTGNVATILNKINEIGILIQSMNTNVKSIQSVCSVVSSETTPTPASTISPVLTPAPKTGTLKCPTDLNNSISTTTGCVQGTYDPATGREMFLGIPYAEPPRRFSRSEPVVPWTTPFLANKFGPACAQFGPSGGDSPFRPNPGQKISEDCLYLNIWRPVDTKSLPILFFIHGGGVSGTGSASAYADNPDLARNAIVVTINYRVGVTGILAHPELSKENSDGISGNLDLRDIILALKWVKANATNLGGDPQKITIFGQSSGAGNVIHLLTSPAATGLFTSAIIQSSPFTAVSAQTIPLKGNAPLTGESFGVVFAKTVGCDPLPSTYQSTTECLRTKSIDDLNKTWTILIKHGLYNGSSVMPLIDGMTVIDSFTNLLKTGQFNRVPVIMGVMSQESGPFGVSLTMIKSWSDLDVALKKDGLTKGIKNINGLVELYNRPKEYDSPAAAFDHYTYETQYLCATRAFLKILETQNVSARAYYNTRGASFYLGGLPIHGSDLFFIFGSATSNAKFLSTEKNLATTMQSIWTSVANNKPSIPKIGSWPLFEGGTWVNLDLKPKIVKDLREEQCDFFDSQDIYFP